MYSTMQNAVYNVDYTFCSYDCSNYYLTERLRYHLRRVDPDRDTKDKDEVDQ